MVAHQLDLFGGPLKPPKKITVDEDEFLPEAPITFDADKKEEAAIVDIDDPELDTVENNTSILHSNNMEWAPDEHRGPGILENTADNVDESAGIEIASDESKALAEAVSDMPVTDLDSPAEITSEPEMFSEFETGEPEEELPPANENFSEDERIETLELVAPVVETHDEETLEDPRFETQENDLDTAENIAISPDNNDAGIIENGNQTTRNKKFPTEQEEDADGLNVPPDEELFKRQYYSMRETSAMFGVNQSLLRFWENEFAVLQPKKNKKGDRYFRPVDIKNLVLIHHLLRVRKFTMDGAKDYLQSHKKAGDTFEMIRRLEKLKSFLFELKAGL
ncbi:MAG: MerR family transcriptional regulator [Bacteroidota bacterium]